MKTKRDLKSKPLALFAIGAIVILSLEAEAARRRPGRGLNLTIQVDPDAPACGFQAGGGPLDDSTLDPTLLGPMPSSFPKTFSEEACELPARGYKSLKALGRGSFGKTYLIEQQRSGKKRPFVLKQLFEYKEEKRGCMVSVGDRPQYLYNDIALQNRAALIAVEGQQIAPAVVDHWLCKSPLPAKAFLVMEYIDGATLLDYVRAKVGLDGDPSADAGAAASPYTTTAELQADPAIRRALAVINALHRNSISHHDLHAGNLMVGRLHKSNGQIHEGVFLIDFGLARKMDSAHSARAAEDDSLLDPVASLAKAKENDGRLLPTLLRQILLPGP